MDEEIGGIGGTDRPDDEYILGIECDYTDWEDAEARTNTTRVGNCVVL